VQNLVMFEGTEGQLSRMVEEEKGREERNPGGGGEGSGEREIVIAVDERTRFGWGDPNTKGIRLKGIFPFSCSCNGTSGREQQEDRGERVKRTEENLKRRTWWAVLGYTRG